MYKIIQSTNQNSFVSSFPYCIPLISFSRLVTLAKAWSTVLNRYEKTGYTFLSPDFSGTDFNFSLFRKMSCCKLPLLCWVLSLVFYASPGHLLCERMLDFVKTFPISNEKIIYHLFSNLFMWCIAFIDLCMLNHPWISWMKPIWSWWIIFSRPVYVIFFMPLMIVNIFFYNFVKNTSCACDLGLFSFSYTYYYY